MCYPSAFQKKNVVFSRRYCFTRSRIYSVIRYATADSPLQIFCLPYEAWPVACLRAWHLWGSSDSWVTVYTLYIVAYTYFNIKQHIYTLDKHKMVHVELPSLEAKCPCRVLKCEVIFFILNCTSKQKRKLICILFVLFQGTQGEGFSFFSAFFFFPIFWGRVGLLKEINFFLKV